MQEERWKTVYFGSGYINAGTVQVSDHGRIRTFNNNSNGKIIAASMVNGYRIFRTKLYKPREEKTQLYFNRLKKKVQKHELAIKKMQQSGLDKRTIKNELKLLAEAKKDLSLQFSNELKSRGINRHGLIHRLVAENFLKKPSKEYTIVAHIDYDKLNNHVSNLKWMTREQNFRHQQESPYVINQRTNILSADKEKAGTSKLTITKVKHLKKLLSQNKTIRSLANKFQVSETQVLRIKRGQNWAEIKPAP